MWEILSCVDRQAEIADPTVLLFLRNNTQRLPGVREASESAVSYNMSTAVRITCRDVAVSIIVSNDISSYSLKAGLRR